MRGLFIFLLIGGVNLVQAQSYAPTAPLTVTQLQQQALLHNTPVKDSLPAKKWFFNKSIGLSSSFGFFNGGRANIFSVPVGLQLSRKLHDNWYAYAGVAVAPSLVSLNTPYLQNPNAKFVNANNGMQSTRFDMFSRAELGLMYVNDQKTFSISGSIGVERSTNPFMPFNTISPVRPAASNVFNR